MAQRTSKATRMDKFGRIALDVLVHVGLLVALVAGFVLGIHTVFGGSRSMIQFLLFLFGIGLLSLSVIPTVFLSPMATRSPTQAMFKPDDHEESTAGGANDDDENGGHSVGESGGHVAGTATSTQSQTHTGTTQKDPSRAALATDESSPTPVSTAPQIEVEISNRIQDRLWSVPPLQFLRSPERCVLFSTKVGIAGGALLILAYGVL